MSQLSTNLLMQVGFWGYGGFLTHDFTNFLVLSFMNSPLIFCPHLFGSTNLLTQVGPQKDGEASLKWNYPISWFRHLRTASLYFVYIFFGSTNSLTRVGLKRMGRLQECDSPISWFDHLRTASLYFIHFFKSAYLLMQVGFWIMRNCEEII